MRRLVERGYRRLTSFQTSDVTIISAYMRRLTTFHATISFLFALAILGLLLDGFVTNIS
jgi:uncharacterized membrane protein